LAQEGELYGGAEATPETEEEAKESPQKPPEPTNPSKRRRKQKGDPNWIGLQLTRHHIPEKPA
jgi:hypothetical protein